MGGRVAEEIYRGDITTGASNDLERATKIARSIVTQYGMSPLGQQVFGQPNHEVFLGRDFTQSRNLIIAAVILVSALGFNSVGGITLYSSESLTISLSGLAIAAILGIALNAILPGNDYEFGQRLEGDTSANLQV
jgi:hypothetical protein